MNQINEQEQHELTKKQGKHSSGLKTDMKVINRDMMNIIMFIVLSAAVIAALYFLL
ncbi:hypothetical protein LQV63_14395 [Paenibacillus profundus]|uniref:Uncharacterized protein n=1 Tax=Paenibacillus profundus TaxID=1173085 RepID=A0ABS8YHB3_9BACL|nr:MULTISPECIES: hypothetical protein [Paenibacillus]MCE5170502.1 hypothetical protein [Paenibacillus profundus]MCM3340164.1 hypothetical protein [Paenibacillus sp. MER TA 81-3]